MGSGLSRDKAVCVYFSKRQETHDGLSGCSIETVHIPGARGEEELGSGFHMSELS